MGPPQDDARELTWWDRLKIGLALGLVILLMLVMVVTIFEGAVMNFDCPFMEFIQFKCWRWGFGLGK